MSNDDELTETLIRIGQGTTPPPDPAFADRLDAHLRTVHVEQASGRGPRPAWVPSLVGLVGLAGVVIVAVLGLSLTGGEPPVVVMTAAEGTDVVLPGELAAPGTAGQRLPDGTRIVVGSEGEAVVGGVILGPGAEAIVVGDRLEVVGGEGTDVAPPTTPPTLRPAPSDAPTTDSATGRSDTSGSPTTAPEREPADRQTSVPETDGPVTSPPPSRPGGDDPDTTPSPPSSRPAQTTGPPTTVSTPGTASTTTRPRPEPSIDLTVDAAGSDRIVLSWVLDDANHPARWRIEAVAGDRVATLAVLRDGTARTATVARFDARRAGFRVVALRADGSDEIASEIVLQPAP